VVSAIVMASGALRYPAVLEVLVTITAVEFTMQIIQLKAGDGMPEIRLIPAAMAICTSRT